MGKEREEEGRKNIGQVKTMKEVKGSREVKRRGEGCRIHE